MVEETRDTRSEGDDGGQHRLRAIAVVLVEPEGPRNVGSVARAMRNFGLSDLRLVGGVDPLDPESLEMGVRSHALLGSARRCATLEEALEDRGFVIATTARKRDRVPALTPHEGAPRILEEAGRTGVALVMGRENHGLTAEEVRRAHATIAIPTSPECRALNLAQALGVIAYELFQASGAPRLFAHEPGGRVIDGALRGRLFEELEHALRDLGLVHDGNAEACQQSLQRMLSVGPIEARDARLLFALARRISGRPSTAHPDAASPVEAGPAPEGQTP